MKKILLVCCFAIGTALAANAQTTTAAAPDAANDAVKATAKSCCATMAEAVEKGCAEAPKATASTAEATKAETAPATTADAAAAPKASSCCASKAAQADGKPCSGKAMAQAAKEKEEAQKEN